MLSPPAVYTSSLCQPRAISHLLFLFECEREVERTDLLLVAEEKCVKERCDAAIREDLPVKYRKGHGVRFIL